MPQLTSPTKALRAPLWAGLALALTACAGEANTLEGSLGEVLDLGFETVEVSRTAEEVILLYQRPRGEGQDLVLKLVVHAAPESFAGGKSVDLGRDETGAARATLSRSVGDDPLRDLAPIKRGTLRLEGAPELDKPISGEFRVTLDEGGVGAGRTAFGQFSVGRVLPGE